MTTFYIKHAYIANAELVPLQGVELATDERLVFSFKPPTDTPEFTFEWTEMDLEFAASVTGWLGQWFAEPILAHLPKESPRCLRPTPWDKE